MKIMETKTKKANFKVTGISVMGNEHREADGVRYSQENQDQLLIETDSGCTVLGVMDGCSGAKDSKVFATLATEILRWYIPAVVEKLPPKPDPGEDSETWRYRIAVAVAQEIKDVLLKSMQQIASFVTGNNQEKTEQFLRRAGLFGILLAVITDDWTIIFGLGDGVFAVNGELTILQAKPVLNKPQYLAYGLLPTGERKEHAFFQIFGIYDTKEIDSLMLGTDGLLHLAAATEYVREEGFLDLFRSFMKDPEAILGTESSLKALYNLGRPSIFPVLGKSEKGSFCVKSILEPAVLKDDTTMVVAWRRKL